MAANPGCPVGAGGPGPGVGGKDGGWHRGWQPWHPPWRGGDGRVEAAGQSRLLSLPEIIRYATVNGAEFFNFAHLGLLAPGRPGTFLLARGSAAQLPRKPPYLENIFLNGVPSPACRKNPEKGRQSA